MLLFGKHVPELQVEWTRRACLSVGALAGLGVSGTSLQAANGLRSFGRAKRCVLLFLTGGPPQVDTWDPKPDAPVEIRGDLQPIATNVAGIQFSELFPHLAGQAEKLCVLRSVTHKDPIHTSAGYTMLTGRVHPQANGASARLIRPSINDHPHFGAILSKFRPSTNGLPSFVALPEIIRDNKVNEYPGQEAGFLGTAFGPLMTEADVSQNKFRRPVIALPEDVNPHRLDNRQTLLGLLEANARSVSGGDLREFRQRAFDLIGSPAAQRAFELDREPAANREAYGPHLFSQGCLLARRLLEAGVSLVTVYWHYEGPEDSPVWDTHANNHAHLKNRLAAPVDRGLASLLRELSERGMLEETMVLCWGEFGRSPKINRNGGRDHWPHAQSILTAGAGLPGGTVYGATDRTGAAPADHPVSPADLSATVLHFLGLPADLELHDRTGRPHRASEGNPVKELIAS